MLCAFSCSSPHWCAWVPFDPRRELVPWCHCAMEFHLYRLVSALVPMPGLLCCRIFKDFPIRLLQCELSCIPHIPPSLQLLFFGVSASGMGASRRCAVRCQNHNVHLGLVPGCSSFQCRQIKGEKVNSYNLSAEGTLPSQGHGPSALALAMKGLCYLHSSSAPYNAPMKGKFQCLVNKEHCFGDNEAPLPFGSL